jgi:hypothetical protein
MVELSHSSHDQEAKERKMKELQSYYSLQRTISMT